MSSPRALKDRLYAFLEARPWLRPLRDGIEAVLVARFRAGLAWQRTVIAARLFALRVTSGKQLVVVYRDVGIGDFVCTFPIVAELKGKFPHALVVYVTKESFVPFVGKFSGADRTLGTSYIISSYPLPKLPSWVALKSFHPLYFDEQPVFPKVERLGYVREMARYCDLPLSDAVPHLPVAAAEVEALGQRLKITGVRPYIGLHTGPTLPVREWPWESWRHLVEMGNRELGATFFLFGSSWHSSHPSRLKGDLPVQVNLTDRLDLIETTQLISMMDLFIGVDSGLLHIANAQGVRCIGLFGPTDPAIAMCGESKTGLYLPDLPCIFCQHRQLKLHWKTGCPHDIRCMTELSPETVFAKVKELLKAA